MTHQLTGFILMSSLSSGINASHSQNCCEVNDSKPQLSSGIQFFTPLFGPDSDRVWSRQVLVKCILYFQHLCMGRWADYLHVIAGGLKLTTQMYHSSADHLFGTVAGGFVCILFHSGRYLSAKANIRWWNSSLHSGCQLSLWLFEEQTLWLVENHQYFLCNILQMQTWIIISILTKASTEDQCQGLGYIKSALLGRPVLCLPGTKCLK